MASIPNQPVLPAFILEHFNGWVTPQNDEWDLLESETNQIGRLSSGISTTFNLEENQSNKLAENLNNLINLIFPRREQPDEELQDKEDGFGNEFASKFTFKDGGLYIQTREADKTTAPDMEFNPKKQLQYAAKTLSMQSLDKLEAIAYCIEEISYIKIRLREQ